MNRKHSFCSLTRLVCVVIILSGIKTHEAVGAARQAFAAATNEQIRIDGKLDEAVCPRRRLVI